MSDPLVAEGVEEIVSALRRELDVVLAPVTQAIAVDGQNRLSNYPAARRAKQAFQTAKQRRGFFAKLRAGQIEVPYRRGGKRSETLGRKWQIVPANGPTRRLINPARYAALVHHGKKQAGYHKGTWPTDEATARDLENDGTVDRLVIQALRTAYGAE